MESVVVEEKQKQSLSSELQTLKTRVHARLIEILDLSLLDSLSSYALKREIKKVTERILS